MSFLCVHVDDDDRFTFQVENDAGRLVRLMTKGWVAYQLEFVDGSPEVGEEVTISAGTEVSRSVSHEVSLAGEVIGTGSVNIATNSE